MSIPKIKDFLPHSLLGRSLLILVMPILIIQIFTVFIFLDRHWDTMTQRLAYALAGELAIIADRYEVDPYSDGAQMIKKYSADHLDLDVAFRPDDHISVERNEYVGWGRVVHKSLYAAMTQEVKKPFQIEISMAEKWVVVYIQLDGGVLRVWCPIRRLFSSSGYIFLLWMMGSSIIMLGIAVLFMRNQIRPIRRLAIAADRYGRGQSTPTLKPSGAREVRAATKAFAKMKSRIDRHLAQRTSMLAGVSHDLRTPLTRMKIQLSMMDGGDVEALLGDVSDMEKMIEAYLEFVRGDGDENVQMMNMNDFIHMVVEKQKRNDVRLKAKINTPITMRLRPVAMERCLNNIILNASKYAKNVWLKADVDSDGKFLEIEIDDDGQGVPEDLYEEVFKPFFRVEESRNQKTGGSGLGLPIAQSIVHTHGGDVTLSESHHGGLAVSIKLPI